MKIQFQTSGILFIVVFFCAFLIQNNIVHATNQQCPLDVQILYSDDSWCSGTTEIGNDTLVWDLTSITFVTLGVANLNSAKHLLNRLILTTEELSGNFSKNSENHTLSADLPLILSPLRYWKYDLSCPPCQSLGISLEVDGEWFEFTPNQLLSDAGIYVDSTYWPPHWSKVSHYTESNITPVIFPGLFSCVGLVTIILLFHRHKKRV